MRCTSKTSAAVRTRECAAVRRDGWLLYLLYLHAWNPRPTITFLTLARTSAFVSYFFRPCQVVSSCETAPMINRRIYRQVVFGGVQCGNWHDWDNESTTLPWFARLSSQGLRSVQELCCTITTSVDIEQHAHKDSQRGQDKTKRRGRQDQYQSD